MNRVRLGFGITIMLMLALLALAAPWIAAQDPNAQRLDRIFAAPLWSSHDEQVWLGADSLGRDVFARMVHGARAALVVALLGAGSAAFIGTALGLLAGYRGGWIDALISRLVDIWMSFPAVLLCILLAALIGTGLHTVVIAIALVDWTRFCRVVRAEVRVQQARDYVIAATSLGLSPLRILTSEILPNIAPLLITLLTLEMSIAIVVEAILAFVGLSATHVPTWGNVLQEGRQYVHQAWWLMAVPMLFIITTLIGLTALGEGLSQRLDPVRRQ